MVRFLATATVAGGKELLEVMSALGWRESCLLPKLLGVQCIISPRRGQRLSCLQNLGQENILLEKMSSSVE